MQGGLGFKIMLQAHLIISGFVQGVGFRHFVKRNVVKLGLKGWVRNLTTNQVEAVLQSSAGSDQEAKEEIEEMIKICKKGPFLSEVKKVDVKWEEGEEIKGFEIVV